MAIPLLSPATATPHLNQMNAQLKPDHAMIAVAGHLANQSISKGKSDTVTISKRAVQMVKSPDKSKDDLASQNNVASPDQKKQGR